MHDTWRGLAQGIGEEARVDDMSGTFFGIDENFGMLLRDGNTTHLFRATQILEEVWVKLARTIHFDDSDTLVFAVSVRTGEWCISGGFEFSNWGEADLAGMARQAFIRGWFGLETGGACDLRGPDPDRIGRG